MSAEKLLLTRAEVLAVSHASAAQPLDRAGADAAIRSTIDRLGGVGGCRAALAEEYGDRPETAAPRMRWARRTVAELYRAETPRAIRAGSFGSVGPVQLAAEPIRRLVLTLPPSGGGTALGPWAAPQAVGA